MAEFRQHNGGKNTADIPLAATLHETPALRRHPAPGVNEDIGINKHPRACGDGVEAHCSKKSASMLARNRSGV
jgi:hypothetical protein